jgi:hypothetical protein
LKHVTPSRICEMKVPGLTQQNRVLKIVTKTQLFSWSRFKSSSHRRVSAGNLLLFLECSSFVSRFNDASSPLRQGIPSLFNAIAFTSGLLGRALLGAMGFIPIDSHKITGKQASNRRWPNLVTKWLLLRLLLVRLRASLSGHLDGSLVGSNLALGLMSIMFSKGIASPYEVNALNSLLAISR